MATTFRPDPKRDAAAREIAEGAFTWLQIRLRRQHGAFAAGSKFYGVPSSKGDGSFYYTNLRACSCPDYAKRGAGCKHQRAVALHVERVRQQQREGSADQAGPATQPSGRATCAVCTRQLPGGVLAGVCDDCAEAGLLFDGVAAVKAAFGSTRDAVVQTIGPSR